MKVKDIIDRVTLLYHDLDYRRINQKQYLLLLDDAILETINVRPDSHEKHEVIKLKSGPRQRIPEDGYTLIDVYANKYYIQELDTYYEGKPVFQVARKDLDYLYNWYTSVEDIHYINEFAFDVRTPRDFWVNPPVNSNRDVYVEIGYSYRHPEFSAIDLEVVPFKDVMELPIELADEFRNALIMYVLYKLFSTDSTSNNDVQLAAQYLQNFYNALKVDYSSSLLATSRIIEPTTEGIGVHNEEPSTVQSVQI